MDVSVVGGPSSDVVVVVRGDLDLASAPALREELLDTCLQCCGRVVLDLRDVTFMDCAGCCSSTVDHASVDPMLLLREWPRASRPAGGYLRTLVALPTAHDYWRTRQVAVAAPSITRLSTRCSCSRRSRARLLSSSLLRCPSYRGSCWNRSHASACAAARSCSS